MISTRCKLILLFLLNVGIILIPKEEIYIFMGLIVVFNLFFINTVMYNLKTLILYLLGLFCISIVLNLIWSDATFISATMKSIKIFTIIDLSIILINNINIMELVAFLSQINIPSKIAVALGVGFRYFGLLTNDIRRINFVQSINGYGFQNRNKNGLLKTVNAFLTPLFLNILNHTEHISISVSIQDIETRAKNFKFNKFNITELFLLIVSFAIILYGIYRD